jgi:hypothetical protein
LIGKYFLRKKGAKPGSYQLSSSDKSTAPSGYYYSYSYQYTWVDKQENLLLESYIGSKLFLKLTDKQVRIVHKRKRKEIPLRYLQGISLEFKRLMLPLIIGGIIWPLSIVGLFSHYLTIFTGMAFLMTGLLLFYYGYRGAWQLNFHLKGQNISLFVDERMPSLDNFIHFAKQAILVYGSGK